MKVPAKTHYALKILVDLGLSANGEPCRISEIAERQGIPKQFLHQILLGLKGSGLVRSQRGLRGGYLLAVAPDELSVASVVRSTQGELLSGPTSADASSGGAESAVCEVWDVVRDRLESELDALTIADLCDRVASIENAANYVI